MFYPPYCICALTTFFGAAHLMQFRVHTDEVPSEAPSLDLAA